MCSTCGLCGLEIFWKLSEPEHKVDWATAFFKITLLRVIPTMSFIHFVTGKSSGILFDISSGILSGISSGILSGISSGILNIIYSNLLAFYLANILALYLEYFLAFYLTFYLAYLLAFDLAFEVQRCALSSEGPGWGPAVRTELGRSQVEVQRCALS